MLTLHSLYGHFTHTLHYIIILNSGASYSKVRKTHFFSRLNNTVNDEEGESIWVKTIDLMIDQNKVDHFTSGNCIIFMHCMKSLSATKIDKSLPNTEFFPLF